MNRKVQSREHILATAERLFYEFGIAAVGVDRISEEAGVGKMTLYRHFSSKNALIRAYLERRDHYWRDQLTRAIESGSGEPENCITQLFERMDAWFNSPDFLGCAFINADAERVNDGITALIREHKAMMRELIRRQINKLDIVDPETLTEQIFILLEGAIVTARLTRSEAPARTAGKAAMRLIETAAKK